VNLFVRRVVVAFVTALVAVTIVTGCARHDAGSSTPSRQASPQVVATVDGAPVTRAEVDETVVASRLTGAQLTYRQALNAVIRRRLVEAEAAKSGVTVPDAALRARLAAVVAASGGKGAFQRALSSAGLTADAYRRQLRGSMLAERLADARFPALRSTVAEARAYYQRLRGRLTRPAEVELRDITTKTEREAEEVQRRLQDGADFAAVARQLSADPESKQRGGLLGWVRTDSLPPTIARAVARLKVGGTTGPVQAIGGWHVLRLLGRHGAKVYSFSELKGDIRAELTRRERAAALSRLIAADRAKARIGTSP